MTENRKLDMDTPDDLGNLLSQKPPQLALSTVEATTENYAKALKSQDDEAAIRQSLGRLEYRDNMATAGRVFIRRLWLSGDNYIVKRFRSVRI
jgi:hypothetical protein